MKPAETKRIYETACRSKRAEIVQEEFQRWHRVLRGFEARDVEAGLDAWWADDTPTHNGRPRGAFLPEPAELKPLVEAAQRKREAAAREPQDLLIWRCTKCIHTCTSYIAHSAIIGGNKCRACGAPMACERKAA